MRKAPPPQVTISPHPPATVQEVSYPIPPHYDIVLVAFPLPLGPSAGTRPPSQQGSICENVEELADTA